jgi:hypothetical protein
MQAASRNNGSASRLFPVLLQRAGKTENQLSVPQP